MYKKCSNINTSDSVIISFFVKNSKENWEFNKFPLIHFRQKPTRIHKHFDNKIFVEKIFFMGDNPLVTLTNFLL